MMMIRSAERGWFKFQADLACLAELRLDTTDENQGAENHTYWCQTEDAIYRLLFEMKNFGLIILAPVVWRFKNQTRF